MAAVWVAGRVDGRVEQTDSARAVPTAVWMAAVRAAETVAGKGEIAAARKDELMAATTGFE